MSDEILIYGEMTDIGTKGDGPVMGTGRVSKETLKKNLESVVGTLKDVVENIPVPMKGYDLEEIEFKLEVSAEGSISLIGSIEVGATGGISLKYKKSKKKDE